MSHELGTSLGKIFEEIRLQLRLAPRTDFGADLIPKGCQNHNVLVYLRPAKVLEHPQILALLPAEPGIRYSLDVHKTVELSVCGIP